MQEARHHRLLLGPADRVAVRRAQLRLKAGVAWYGRMRAADALHPKHPLDLVGVQSARARPLRRRRPRNSRRDGRAGSALKKANKTAEIIVYPDTPHGFNGNDEALAEEDEGQGPEDGWKRMLAWFKQYGVA